MKRLYKLLSIVCVLCLAMSALAMTGCGNKEQETGTSSAAISGVIENLSAEKENLSAVEENLSAEEEVLSAVEETTEEEQNDTAAEDTQSETTNKTESSNKTDSTSKTESSNKTDSTSKTETTNKTDSSSKTESTNKTDSSSKTETTNKTDSSSKTESSNKTDSSSKTETTNKTDGSNSSTTNKTETSDKTEEAATISTGTYSGSHVYFVQAMNANIYYSYSITLKDGGSYTYKVTYYTDMGGQSSEKQTESVSGTYSVSGNSISFSDGSSGTWSENSMSISRYVSERSSSKATINVSK